MTFAFDLISDLHADHLPLDWRHQATSPVCVVAGDVAQDRELLIKTLRHLGQNYQAVFYIDGNEEHRRTLNHLKSSYEQLKKDLRGIPNVLYMQDNVVILQGVALIATNAWYSFDYDSQFPIDQVQQKICQYYEITNDAADEILRMSVSDARYFESSITRLQTHLDVKKIVLISHYVPHGDFLTHDLDMAGTYRINASVNRFIPHCLQADTENKVTTWCFGHYHQPVDRVKDGIRYVCNPRGRHGTKWYRSPYYPQRIEI